MTFSLLNKTGFFLIASLTLLACKSKSTRPERNAPPVAIEKDTLYDGWQTNDLFKTVLERQGVTIDLTQTDTVQVDIRAFKNQFFYDTTRLKPTWVVGYVLSDTKFGDETLPGPILRATSGQPSHVRYINRLDETMRANPNYPLLKYELKETQFDQNNNPISTLKKDSCKWFPIIYDVRNTNNIAMVRRMLYPQSIPFQENNIPVCRIGQNGSKIPEMSTYYSTTVHLHGANVSWHNDGYVNSMVSQTDLADTPPYTSLPISFGLFGPKPDELHQFVSYRYPNSFPEGQYEPTGQPDSTRGDHGAILWYHDHAMMHTTANVYAGMAGAYIIEGKNEYSAMDNVYSNLNTNRNMFRKAWDWVRQRETNDIPLLISDKSFSTKGFLYYNTTGSLTNSKLEGPTPEFLGNTITVNGKIWPSMSVEPEIYRFRLLNTSSTRTYRFGLRRKNKLKADPIPRDLDSSVFVQIGTEGGLMPNRVKVTQDQPLTLAPGERADVLIDFSRFSQSDSLMLVNYAPSIVYQGDSTVALTDINPDNLTNFVMAFVVTGTGAGEPGRLEQKLTDLKKTTEFQNITSVIRQWFRQTVNKPYNVFAQDTLDEKAFKLKLFEVSTFDSIPSRFRSSIKDMSLISYPFVLMASEDWNSEVDTSNHDPSTIKRVGDGTEEIWAITNTTDDRHPIHIHLNRFTILGRRDINSKDSLIASPNERGWKDVVQCTPHQTTYIRVKYLLSQDATQQGYPDEVGQFVYHCHILEHEDAGMMRRLIVRPSPHKPL